MRVKNILIIIQHLYRGGAEKSAAALCGLLQAQGHNVVVVTFFSENDYPTSYPISCTHYCLNNYPKKSLWNRVVNNVKRIKELSKIKKQHNITTSISFLFGADIANVISDVGEHKIISIRSAPNTSNHGKWKRLLVDYFYNKANIVMVQNNRLVAEMQTFLNIKKPKIQVIPNFYELDTIKKNAQKSLSSNEAAIADPRYKVLFQIARLSEPKAQWYLFRIFKEVLKTQPLARLVIAGEGEMQDFLLKYAQDLGLSIQIAHNESKIDQQIDLEAHQIILLGHCANPVKYIKHSRLFLFTSFFEGFPNALAEAMIAGSLAISSDCVSGPKELIAPNIAQNNSINYPLFTEYGVLLPPFVHRMVAHDEPLYDAEKAWIDTVLSTIDDLDLQQKIKTQAQERMNEFGTANITNLWENILR